MSEQGTPEEYGAPGHYSLRFTCVGGIVFEGVFETKEDALVPFGQFQILLHELGEKKDPAMPMAPGKPLIFQAMNGTLAIQPASVLCCQLISLEENVQHSVRLNSYFLRIEEAKRQAAGVAPGFTKGGGSGGGPP